MTQFAPAGRAQRRDTGATRRPLRVVLVDDEEDIRSLVRVTLEIHGGFEVVAEAADGVQAIAVAAAERPDAIVLDVSMPVMDGLDALPRIKAVCPNAHVLVFSASDCTQVFPEAGRRGADACVEKGAELDMIAEALVDICGDRRDADPPFQVAL